MSQFPELPDPTSPLTPPVLGKQPGDRLIHQAPRATLVQRQVLTNSGKSLPREVVLHPGAVIILPILEDQRIVMIRNRRHTVNQELLELPAGTLEVKPDGSPESPALCATRELLEETGYSAKILSAFGWFYTSPGILTEKMYAFIATSLTLGQQNLEDNEQIRVEVLSRDTILALLQQNRIVDAKSIATLLKYFIQQTPE